MALISHQFPEYSQAQFKRRHIAATGAQLWVQRYNSPGNGNDAAYSVAVSPGGSRVYVTGLTGPFHYDYATVAHSAG